MNGHDGGTESAAGAPPMIEARGLSKYYGPFVAVEDISFSILQGQVVRFSGRTARGRRR